MSTVKVNDLRGGKYQAIIEFTYGECERLPFNLLRRYRAKLKTLSGAGLAATAVFNIRAADESSAFLELLDLFGEDGSFNHGSAADASALELQAPPAGMDGDIEEEEDDDLEMEDDASSPGE